MSQRPLVPGYVKFLLVVLVLAGAGYGWYIYSRPTFWVAPVIREDAPKSAAGTVTVREEIPTVIRSPIGGLIKDAKLEIGAFVKAGETLVQLDTGDIDLEIEINKEQIDALNAKIDAGAESELAVRGAKIDFENNKFMFENKLMSAADFEKAKLALEGAELRAKQEKAANTATMNSLKSALKVKERQREKMTIKSPVDGQISDVIARAGNLIAAETSLLTVISLSRTVTAQISEENFAGVAVGKSATVRFLKFGEQLIGASVIKVLPTADPLTQRKVVYLHVDVPQEQLDPGLTGEVAIVIDTHEKVLCVPRRALFAGGRLFVVTNGVVELRMVKTGYMGANRAEIVEGVKEGELVITEDMDQVRAGDRVKTRQETKSTAT